MPPIKQNQVLDNSVKTAFDDLNGALKVTLEGLGLLVTEAKKIQDSFGGAKGIKEFTTALDKLNKNKKESETLTNAQINLLAKEDILRKKAAEATIAEQKALNLKQTAQIKDIKEAERQAKKAEIQAKKSAKLTGAYARQSKALTLLRNRAKNLALTYGENSKQFLQAEKRVVSLNSKLTKLDARLGQSQRNVGNYKSGLAGLRSGFMSLAGAFGFIGGMQLFAKTLISGIKSVRDYEKGNAELASVLGKQIKDIPKLTKESERLGRTTAFTSNQVNELQIELARLGKSEEDIIASTEGIIDATIALGSETGETAALVGATLNAFNLGASKSSHVANVLTLATQRSALSFDKLNTALPNVAGAAAAVGVPLEKVVAQLGQAADRGIDASTAGTALRNIYLKLSAAGLTLDEALIKINSSQNKATTANKLFGVRAVTTALAIADNVEKTDQLTESLINVGDVAKRVSETQLNTLDGQLKLLDSAWDGFIKTIIKTDTAKEAIKGITASVDNLRKTILGTSSVGAEIADEIINSIGKNSDTAAEKVNKLNIAIKAQRENLEKNIELYTPGKQTFLEALFIPNRDEVERGQIEILKITEKTTSTIEILQKELANELIKLEEEKRQAQIDSIDLTKESLDRLIDLQGKYSNNFNILTDKQKIFLEALNSEIEKRNKLVSEEIDLGEDLIEIQKELLKEAKKLPGTTEKEIALRNRNIESINKEISRLKELGTTQDLKVPKQIKAPKFNFEVDQKEQTIDELERLEQIELDNYLDKEKKKTDILKEQTAKRVETEREFYNQAKETAIDIGNSLFDIKSEQLEDESERIREEYDTRLAVDELDEEQRAAIEAERTQEENVLAERQRELEKKQFLFNKGVSAAEIGIDTATKVAGIKANAALLLSNPITAPFAPLALAQIPFVIGAGALAIGAIASQAIPQFDSGVEHAPGGGFIAGEKRFEFMKHKGKVSLIKEPTYFGDEYKGATIVGGAESATMLENITRNEVADNSTKEVYLQMDYTNAILKSGFKDLSKSLRKDNKPVNNFKAARMAKYINDFSA